ncbi:uncharacterized protein LOC114243181 [Bombyx mandarina]|uniref:Uncharacterized protein LOC114243181 n=1 Tax=Bombyx mandarina TaxID=7092 RepID=A0A6J2JM40_BOMMA|nr:uncharacterized protein LOC114243181 [Bombyx mandarina]
MNENQINVTNSNKAKSRPLHGLKHLQEKCNIDSDVSNRKGKLDADKEIDDNNEDFKFQCKTFIEISKYFSSPLRKTASYISENCLVSYPNSFALEYKRGGLATEYIKFSNITLQPVYVRLFKLIPELDQIKFINLNLSCSKRIPPGLSFNMAFIYNDANEKPACNASLICVASRKTTTPCYQICKIELQIYAQKICKPNF